MTINRWILSGILAFGPLAVGITPHLAAQEQAAVDKAAVTALANQGADWLLAQQLDNGAFFGGEPFSLGITALATLALIEQGKPIDHPQVAKALRHLKNFQQEDGGIYNPEAGLGNYTTSISLMAFAAAGITDEKIIKPAQAWLLGLQNTEGGINDGGIGYGSRGQGNEDLSNTAMAIEALRSSGIPAEHPAMQRALAFVQRCQNLTSHNQLEWAKNGDNDGSAVYSPDSSKAGGSYADGHTGGNPKDKSKPAKAEKLIGYGSMTYALVKSYIMLDVPKDDPRVATALHWIKANYTFDQNPGLAPATNQQGLFYYYVMAAKTMQLLDDPIIETKDGKKDWRIDMYEAINKRAQISDGKASWTNTADRWGEGLPNLVTAYNVLCLAKIAQKL